MNTRINQHGETETVIGTISGLRGERVEVVVTEFRCGGTPCFSLKAGFGGHADARRFSTQVKRAKVQLSDPSMGAEWYC